MHNLLCAAFARLVRCKFFYIGLGAMVLMELYTMLTERYGIQQFGDGLEKAFFQYPMAVTLIVPAFCGLFVGEEYSGGTLRNKIIAGVSRSRIYLANLLLCMFAALCFTFAAMLTGLVAGLPLVGGFQMEPGEIVAYAVCSLGVALSTAAIATLVSQCVSFSILLSFFLTGKSITRLSFRNISRRISVYLEILKIGSSSFCRQGLAGLSTVALNVAAGSYGDAAVAAMSIVGRIFHFLLSALIGFGQGFQPVAGYNYGARRFDRVAEAYGFTVKTGTVFLTVVGVVGWWLAPEVIRLFQSDDPQVVVIGTIAFRAQCLALPLQPTVVLANMLFQSTGRAFRALFISATRQGIYFLPLILILPRFYGLGGVEYTQPLSDLMAFLSSIPFLWSFFRELRGAGTVAEGSAVGGAVPQPAGSR